MFINILNFTVLILLLIPLLTVFFISLIIYLGNGINNDVCWSNILVLIGYSVFF